ncbi:MAG: hypothetical protein R3A10_16420 [Caldilineaceae bacterium]
MPNAASSDAIGVEGPTTMLISPARWGSISRGFAVGKEDEGKIEIAELIAHVAQQGAAGQSRHGLRSDDRVKAGLFQHAECGNAVLGKIHVVFGRAQLKCECAAPFFAGVHNQYSGHHSLATWSKTTEIVTACCAWSYVSDFVLLVLR